MYIHIYGVCIYIYIHIWYPPRPPMNYRLSCCIVTTVLSQLFRQVRIPYLWKTAKTQLTCQENAPGKSFRFDVSTHSTATLCFSNQEPTFSWETNKPKTPSFGKLYGPIPKKTVIWFSLGKGWFSVQPAHFSLEKDGFGTKKQLFLRESWFWVEKPTLSWRKPKKGRKTNVS